MWKRIRKYKEKGPKTFDIEGTGVPENEIITINHKGTKVNGVSKGVLNIKKVKINIQMNLN